MSNFKVVNCRRSKDNVDLESLTREELIERVRQLEAHVFQLQNLLKTDKNSDKPEKERKGKPFDHKKYGKRHVLLQVAYVGWEYAGFVVQEHTDKTIEAEIFKALEKTRLVESRETSNYHRCGRTDKGVSSFGQVISIDLRTNLAEGIGVYFPEGYKPKTESNDDKDEIPYVSLLNRVLPSEIRVIAWAPVIPSFSARFNCSHRTYHYYFPKSNLNIDNMRIAAQHLIGEHDFRNFCKMDVGNGVVQFRRTINDIQIEALEDESDSYSMFRLKLVGQAFLWHQVRCIVAVLFLVGQGKEETSIVQELLNIELNPRKPQYGMASEIPLNLFKCSYSEAGSELIHDTETLRLVIENYQSHWAIHCVKMTMLRDMIDELEKISGVKVNNQVKGLLHGFEPKTYLPLMKRPTCESLEERIEHYAKKKRISVEENVPAS